MRLEVDLPEWCDDRHIYVFGGIELAAYQLVGRPMMVKAGRCNMCGRCCPEDCEHLKPDGDKLVCGLGMKRPFICCLGFDSGSVEGCSERYEEA